MVLRLTLKQVSAQDINPSRAQNLTYEVAVANNASWVPIMSERDKQSLVVVSWQTQLNPCVKSTEAISTASVHNVDEGINVASRTECDQIRNRTIFASTFPAFKVVGPGPTTPSTVVKSAWCFQYGDVTGREVSRSNSSYLIRTPWRSKPDCSFSATQDWISRSHSIAVLKPHWRKRSTAIGRFLSKGVITLCGSSEQAIILIASWLVRFWKAKTLSMHSKMLGL